MLSSFMRICAIITKEGISDEPTERRDRQYTMKSHLHIWPQASQTVDHTTRIFAILEGVEGGRREFWFRIPSERLGCVTDLADPFVTATIFTAMRSATDLRVHGSVSHLLLRNLEEFQTAWHSWRPDCYHVVNVIADQEVQGPVPGPDRAVIAFSGGLDSCFSVWRHTQGECGRLIRPLKAAAMVHGFDIPLHESDVFSRAAENSRAIVQSVGLDFIPMACAFRELGDNWEDAHGAALASCLSLFSREFPTGLVAGSHAYNTLRFPWGSNPLTDPMLSSGSFSIVYDAAGVTRLQKAKGVSEWDEAMRLLRVCWQGTHKDRNCGACLRCIGTALCFAAMGVRPPVCLGVPSLDEGIRKLRAMRIAPVAVTRLEEILDTARGAGIKESWVGVLETCIRHKKKQNRRGPCTRRARAIVSHCRMLGQDLYRRTAAWARHKSR